MHDLSLHGYILLLHLPHVPFNKHIKVPSRFIVSPVRSNFASFTFKTSFEMSQSNYSSVNHNRQLGIVREKVPKGNAFSFSSGGRTAPMAHASSSHCASNPSALSVSSQRNSALTVMTSKCVKIISKASYIRVQESMKIFNSKSYTNFYSKSYSILFLEKNKLWHLCTSVPHNVILLPGTTSVLLSSLTAGIVRNFICSLY